MNLQSRQFRWLRVLEDARAVAHSNVVSATQWLERNPLREDMQRVTTITSTDGVRLLAEADDLAEGSWLRTTLAPVFDAAGQLEAASENLPAELRHYEQAVSDAIDVLRDNDDEPDVEEVISELERTFRVSLLATLTAHNFLLKTVQQWEGQHNRWVSGAIPDLGHYFDFRTLQLATEPGTYRIHIQHLRSAIDAGTHVMNPFDLGPDTSTTTTNYPELQIMLYGQWVVYFYTIWDEYFRHVFADACGCNADDIKIDFFGDLRNMRRDIIHKQGVAFYSPKNRIMQWFAANGPLRITAQQTFQMFELFPTSELRSVAANRDHP
jgi:hypothetical protein